MKHQFNRSLSSEKIDLKDDLKTKSHLSFELLSKVGNAKTDVWAVVGYQDTHLGHVHWHNGWRQYVFEPIDEYATVWSHDCLTELAVFIKAQMEARK